MATFRQPGVINGKTLTFAEGASDAIAAEASNSFAITLANGDATTLAELVALLMNGGGANAEALRTALGLEHAGDEDADATAEELAAAKAKIDMAAGKASGALDSKGNRIITHDGGSEAAHDGTAPAGTDARIAAGGQVDTGIRIAPDSAADADGDAVSYRLKSGAFDNNLVELVDTDGDGTLEIRFKSGQRPDFESQRGDRTDGKYKFVVEAYSTSTLRAGDD